MKFCTISFRFHASSSKFRVISTFSVRRRKHREFQAMLEKNNSAGKCLLHYSEKIRAICGRTSKEWDGFNVVNGNGTARTTESSQLDSLIRVFSDGASRHLRTCSGRSAATGTSPRCYRRTRPNSRNPSSLAE